MPESITANVGGKLVTSTAEFTRPADTTAYTAGDVVSNSTSATTLMPFTGVTRFLGGSGYVVKGRLETDKKDEIGQYRLILYAVSETAAVPGAPTVSVPADNAADTSIYANRAYRLGYIDFPAASAGAGTASNTAAVALWTGTPLPFVCYGGDQTAGYPGLSAIYGKLVNITGTTPASGQKFSVQLTIDQN